MLHLNVFNWIKNLMFLGRYIENAFFHIWTQMTHIFHGAVGTFVCRTTLHKTIKWYRQIGFEFKLTISLVYERTKKIAQKGSCLLPIPNLRRSQKRITVNILRKFKQEKETRCKTHAWQLLQRHEGRRKKIRNKIKPKKW